MRRSGDRPSQDQGGGETRAGPFPGSACPRASQRAPREPAGTEAGWAGSGEGARSPRGEMENWGERQQPAGCPSERLPSPANLAVRLAAGRRKAGGDWGRSRAARRASGRRTKGLRVSVSLAVQGVDGLGAGLATPGLGGRLREASESLRLGLRFLGRCRGLTWCSELGLRGGLEASREPGEWEQGLGVFRKGAAGVGGGVCVENPDG